MKKLFFLTLIFYFNTQTFIGQIDCSDLEPSQLQCSCIYDNYLENPSFGGDIDEVCSCTELDGIDISNIASVSSTDCLFLPDLTISSWGLLNYGSNSENKGPRIVNENEIEIDTALPNIGKGPVEMESLNEYYCPTDCQNEFDCNCPNDSSPILGVDGVYYCLVSDPLECLSNVSSTSIVNSVDGVKQSIKQNIIKRNEDGSFDKVEYKLDGVFQTYHFGHEHFHMDSYVSVTLRKKDESLCNPLDWPIYSEYSKIGFCLIDVSDLVNGDVSWNIGTGGFFDESRYLYAINDNIEAYCNENYEEDTPWHDTELTNNWFDLKWLPENQENLENVYNTLNSFSMYPNLGLGGTYGASSCNEPIVAGQNIFQYGIASGMLDLYHKSISGNSVTLKENLCAGDDYYLVVEVDPFNHILESNEDNNIAVVPITLPSSVFTNPDDAELEILSDFNELICANEVVTLYSNEMGAPISYDWYDITDTDTPILLGSESTIEISGENEEKIIQLRTNGSCGTLISSNYTLTFLSDIGELNPPPTVSIMEGSTCLDESVSISGAQDATILWPDLPQITTNGSNSASVDVSQSDLNYNVTILDNDEGCNVLNISHEQVGFSGSIDIIEIEDIVFSSDMSEVLISFDSNLPMESPQPEYYEQNTNLNVSLILVSGNCVGLDNIGVKTIITDQVFFTHSHGENIYGYNALFNLSELSPYEICDYCTIFIKLRYEPCSESSYEDIKESSSYPLIATNNQVVGFNNSENLCYGSTRLGIAESALEYFNIESPLFNLFIDDYIPYYFEYPDGTIHYDHYLNVVQEGIYTMYITDIFGCSRDISVNVTFKEHQLNGEPLIEGISMCEQPFPIEIGVEEDIDHTYLWDSGETTSQLIIDDLGVYRLSVINNNSGCQIEKEFIVFDDTYFMVSSTSNNSYLNINNSTTINGYTLGNVITVDETIQVEDELIIENGVTMLFDEDAGINVHEGGRLIVRDGVILKGICDNSWQGVKVNGKHKFAHPTQIDIDAGNHPNHGYLYTNNATIERAIWGVNIVDEANQIYNFNNGNNIPPNANGGGIFQLNNTNFNDNRFGLLIFNHGKNQDHKSFVKQCNFTNTHAWEDLTNDVVYRQILLKGADAIPIEQCSFEKNIIDSQSLLDKTVVGIEAINGGVLSDSDACPCVVPNTFRNLDNGIKITGTMTGGHFISGNQFYGVKQGITATEAFALEINNNTFNNIPEGINNDEASWGIYTDQCIGLRIEQNNFRTTNDSDFTRGMIVKDSEALPTNPDDFNIVRDNTFLGAFEAGILWQGRNDFIDIDCNHFGGSGWANPKADWQLANSTDHDFSLNQQGCKYNIDLDITEPPFSNEWHSGANGLHIENLTGVTQTLALNWHDNSEPTLYDFSDVDVSKDQSCGTSVQCVNNWGDSDGGDTGGNGGTPEGNPDNYCRMAYNPIINDLKNNNRQLVKDEMICLASDFSHTFLTATHIKEGDLENAQFYLDLVTENGEYATTKTQYQDLIINLQEGTGKSNEAFIRIENRAEEKRLSLEKNMAASVLAVLTGNTENKIIDIEYNNQENVSVNQQPLFNIYPNPSGSNDQVYLDLHDSDDEILTIQITNLNGTVVNKVDYFNNNYLKIDNFSPGIYLVSITTKNGLNYINKLSIIK